MPAATIDEAQTVLLAALPETGEATYESVYNALQAQGETLAVAQFHRMRRAKEFGARVGVDANGVPTLYIQRDQYPVDDGGAGGGGGA